MAGKGNINEKENKTQHQFQIHNSNAKFQVPNSKSPIPNS